MPNIVSEAKSLQLLEFPVEAGPVATLIQAVDIAKNMGSITAHKWPPRLSGKCIQISDIR
jgi:hypothetical protein